MIVKFCWHQYCTGSSAMPVLMPSCLPAYIRPTRASPSRVGEEPKGTCENTFVNHKPRCTVVKSSIARYALGLIAASFGWSLGLTVLKPTRKLWVGGVWGGFG